MLTLQQLKDMEPGTIFAFGLTIDNPSGINIAHTDKILRWVAKRGGIKDWAIYIGTGSSEEVAREGDKIFGEENIKRLVPCEDEAFKMYRK